MASRSKASTTVREGDDIPAAEAGGPETGDSTFSTGFTLFDLDAFDGDEAGLAAAREEADAAENAFVLVPPPGPGSPPARSAPAIGKDEMNLAEFPFAVLARRVAPGQKTIEVIQEGRDAGGRPVRQEWLVTGSDAFGLPTAADDEVYVALMKLLRDNQFRERTVRFTVAQLLRVMQSSAGKRDYDRIAASLDRLTGVTIRSKNAFWDHARKRYVTEAFHLLDSYRLTTGSGVAGGGNNGGRELSEVTFSSFLFGSIQSGYVKNLDIDFYFTLSSPLARRYFRLLDKHRYRGSVYEIELRRLAAKLPLQDRFESQLKRRLDPVFDELKARGFLQSAGYREGAGGQTIVQVRFADKTAALPAPPPVALLPPATPASPAAPVTPAPPAAPSAPPEPWRELADILRAQGVNRADAERLAREQPGECRLQLEYLPFVKEFKRSKGAWLRTAIEQGFGPPPAWSEAREAEARKERKRASAKSPAASSTNPGELSPDESAAVAAAARITAEIERLRTEEPDTWARLQSDSEASLPPPIRARPDGPAFRPALDTEVRRRVGERLG